MARAGDRTFFHSCEVGADIERLLDPAEQVTEPWGDHGHGSCDKCGGEGTALYECSSCMEAGADSACPACQGRVRFRETCPACLGDGEIDHTIRHGIAVRDSGRDPRAWGRGRRRGTHEAGPVVARDLLDVGPSEAAHLFRVMLSDRPEGKLAAVRQPGLVLRGERDHVAPADWCRHVTDLLPKGDFREIPVQAHMPHWSGAQAVASALRAFLAQPGSVP
jgi:pimeloyl-ACP methyl ester carboxylesterase